MTAAKVAPDSLGGDQINESTLQGFDQSAQSGSFSSGILESPPISSIGGGLGLRSQCTGGAGSIGFEFSIVNNSGFSRDVYGKSITDRRSLTSEQGQHR